MWLVESRRQVSKAIKHKRCFPLSAGQGEDCLSSYGFQQKLQYFRKSGHNLPHQENGSPKNMKHKISRSSVKCDISSDDDSAVPEMLNFYLIFILWDERLSKPILKVPCTKQQREISENNKLSYSAGPVHSIMQ